MICNTTVCTDSEGWSHITGMTYKQILLMWELENWLVPRYTGPSVLYREKVSMGKMDFTVLSKAAKVSQRMQPATSLSDWID